MAVQPDFKDLLELFNANKVKYIIVGAYALAYHGAPRTTGDIDILVHPDRKNAQSILKAIKEFGFSSINLSVDDFSVPDKVIQLGVAPNRIDIMTSITGVSWEEADKGKKSGFYGNVPAKYLGIKQFIANKRAIGRKKDIADLEAIGE